MTYAATARFAYPRPVVLKPELARLFQDYAQAHRHPLNRLTHKIAIPMIVFNTIAMFDWWHWVELSHGRWISSAHVGIALASAWYLSMHTKLGLFMIGAMFACLALGASTPVWLVLLTGVAGWTVQLIGHELFEKNSPAFVTNVVQSLVGPIFFLAILTGEWSEDAPRA